MTKQHVAPRLARIAGRERPRDLPIFFRAAEDLLLDQPKEATLQDPLLMGNHVQFFGERSE